MQTYPVTAHATPEWVNEAYAWHQGLTTTEGWTPARILNAATESLPYQLYDSVWRTTDQATIQKLEQWLPGHAAKLQPVLTTLALQSFKPSASATIGLNQWMGKLFAARQWDISGIEPNTMKPWLDETLSRNDAPETNDYINALCAQHPWVYDKVVATLAWEQNTGVPPAWFKPMSKPHELGLHCIEVLLIALKDGDIENHPLPHINYFKHHHADWFSSILPQINIVKTLYETDENTVDHYVLAQHILDYRAHHQRPVCMRLPEMNPEVSR